VDQTYRDTARECAGPILCMEDRTAASFEELLEERDAQDPHAKDYEEIIHAYEVAEKEKREQRVAQIDDKRRTKTRDVIAKLAQLLPDEDWKDIALAHHFEKPNLSREKLRIHLVTFECGFVQRLMTPLLESLSKATTEAMKQVASKISADFNLIYSKHFHDFSFLSDKCELQRALRTYCEEHISNGELLKTKRMDVDSLSCISNGYLLASLHMTMGSFSKAFGPLIASASSCKLLSL